MFLFFHSIHKLSKFHSQGVLGLAICISGLVLTSGLIFCEAVNVPPEFIQGTQAMHEGKLEEAAARFAAAAKRQPTFAEAHFNLGLADEELGKYEEAIASLREALKMKTHL